MQTSGSDTLQMILRRTVEYQSSDLHLREGEPPYLRHNGQLVQMPEIGALNRTTLAGLIEALVAKRPDLLLEFERVGEADLSYELPGYARFRANVFRERGRLAVSLRVIPADVPNIDQIGMPPVLKQLALEHHGLVLVTGATGSGKSTTIASMIDHRNRETASHILTIEDPIEIVHSNLASIVSQREVGTDTADFSQALRRALRQDPDVILIGEIRDEETMRTALAAAETGHLVLATLHTINAQETVTRILDLFPADAERQARALLAGALKGIVSQRLARTVDNKRTPAVEVMINTARVADCIANPDDSSSITDAITEGEYYGMQSFDQSLIKLVLAGRIEIAEATRLTTTPQNFKLSLDAALAQAEVDARRARTQLPPKASPPPVPQMPQPAGSAASNAPPAPPAPPATAA